MAEDAFEANELPATRPPPNKPPPVFDNVLGLEFAAADAANMPPKLLDGPDDAAAPKAAPPAALLPKTFAPAVGAPGAGADAAAGAAAAPPPPKLNPFTAPPAAGGAVLPGEVSTAAVPLAAGAVAPKLKPAETPKGFEGLAVAAEVDAAAGPAVVAAAPKLKPPPLLPVFDDAAAELDEPKLNPPESALEDEGAAVAGDLGVTDDPKLKAPELLAAEALILLEVPAGDPNVKPPLPMFPPAPAPVPLGPPSAFGIFGFGLSQHTHLAASFSFITWQAPHFHCPSFGLNISPKPPDAPAPLAPTPTLPPPPLLPSLSSPPS